MLMENMKKDAVWNERVKETGNEKKIAVRERLLQKMRIKGKILHKL